LATLAARQNQGAIDVLSEQVEGVRAEPYAAVAMNATDLGADARIRLIGTDHWFDPDGAGPTAEERVVTAGTAPARLTPHIREVVRSNARTRCRRT
jgi:hypothetical protein